MNSKALAVMLAAVMAFVCFAVVAEQTDAEGETLTIDIEEKILDTPGTDGNFNIVVTTNAAVLVTPVATEGITAPSATTTTEDGGVYKATFNFTYTAKTVSGSSTITFTSEGYPTATCKVYWGVYEITPSVNYVQVADTSSSPSTPAITLTVKGTPIGEEKIQVASSNTSVINYTGDDLTITAGSATLAATGIVQDSYGSTKLNFTIGGASATTFVYAGEAVMEYLNDSANGLKAIVYSSGKVYMDTTEMNLKGTPDVLFDVSYDADGDGTADKTQSFGPVSAQKRILIEIPGYVDFENVGKTTIVMKSKATASAIATLNGGATPAAFDVTALTFKLDKNSGDRPAYSDDDFETSFVETYPAAPAAYVAKNADVTASIYVQGYSFLGWGAESGSTTYFDLELTDGKIKVEEYLFAVSGDMEIFAIWNDIYTIAVEYKYTESAHVEPSENDGKVFLVDGSTVGEAVAKATTSSVAKSGDNLLLRIQQTAPGNYIYTVNAYAAHGWEGDAETTTPATTGTKVVMLTNGIWVIQNVQEDLHIVVTAAESEAPVTGYHFAVDSITNGDNNATAIISWDAIDLVPTGTLSAAGTYFKIDEALGNVYGSLEGNYGQIYNATLKVDNQDNTTAISSGVVTLSEETGYNYDLTITTTGTASDKIFLYAVQGIWSEGNTKTVWSLVA